MKQFIPPASQGNLFVKGFDLRQQPTGQTKSVSVCLYIEQACCGSPSRHSWPGMAGYQFFFSFFFFYHVLVMGCVVFRLVTIYSSCLVAKLAVSLSRLEFLLHTYMAFSRVLKLFKVGFILFWSFEISVNILRNQKWMIGLDSYSRQVFVCCLTHRGSTVGFLLLQCSSGVVRHPRDLQVSVAARFCRVLIFASS